MGSRIIGAGICRCLHGDGCSGSGGGGGRLAGQRDPRCPPSRPSPPHEPHRTPTNTQNAERHIYSEFRQQILGSNTRRRVCTADRPRPREADNRLQTTGGVIIAPPPPPLPPPHTHTPLRAMMSGFEIPSMILTRPATSVRQLRHDPMEQGPTEPHAGRSTFLLSSGGAGGRILLNGV